MKKILLLSSLFALFTIAASAQSRIHRNVQTSQITPGEKFKIHKNQAQFRHAKRKAMRDGRLTNKEKRRLVAMKRKDRREAFYYKHNNKRRF